MEENAKKLGKMMLRLLTRGWLRVIVAFPLADLVKETGLSVTAVKDQLRRLARATLPFCAASASPTGAAPVISIRNGFLELHYPKVLRSDSVRIKGGGEFRRLRLRQ